ncbi:MAG: cytochrome c [Pseudomonadota bacterium]
MKRIAAISSLLLIAAAGAFLVVTAPQRVDPELLAGLVGDEARGERIFDIGGCASCHAAPGSEDEARLVLAGGRRLETPFGVFVSPNISPGAAGLANWSVGDFATAMLKGVSPDGAHYYPSFPYASYVKMRLTDIVDLWAFMKTLPASEAPSGAHEIPFPFNLRRGLGAWKQLYLSQAFVVGPETEPARRGRYLVEGPGHCAECHTPRGALGGLNARLWMSGGPNPSGKGRIPNLTPAALTWSEADIAAYLKSGFTPDYDVVGGSMAEVVRNTARLTDRDRADIAAYLTSLPGISSD